MGIQANERGEREALEPAFDKVYGNMKTIYMSHLGDEGCVDVILMKRESINAFRHSGDFESCGHKASWTPNPCIFIEKTNKG